MAAYINESNVTKPLLAIFTIKDVAPYEELCFSYYGRQDDDDEEDDDNDVRAFSSSLRTRSLSVFFSSFCRLTGQGQGQGRGGVRCLPVRGEELPREDVEVREL